MYRTRPILFLFLLLCSANLSAQTLDKEVSTDTLEKYGVYDGDRLPPSFHAGRRALVLDSMLPNSVALFTAAPERVRANDIDYEFHQDPNIYYLSGCIEPGSALLLSKEAIRISDTQSVHEILFVRNRNPSEETWTGKRLGPDGARAILRIKAAMSIDSLPSMLHSLLAKANLLYYDSHTGRVRDAVLDDSVLVNDSLIHRLIGNRYPSLQFKSLRMVLAGLREVKQPEELALMRRAITISNSAHNRVIHTVGPGDYEYRIQGLAESIFTEYGAEYTAYPCIVGSGPNSTILHYETNRRRIKAGDFIEMDMGAEYHGYCADVTRSFPISGTFTKDQAKIYSLVLEAQDSGIRVCQTGAPFRSAHNAAVRVITRGLLKLGIIKDSADYRKYFMHGTSHYLGLDVHDAGRYGPLVPGNVLTVEPGIYIAEGSPCDKRWWNIGCRIEDDILITENGPEILSIASPRSIGEIEQLMVHKN